VTIFDNVKGSGVLAAVQAVGLRSFTPGTFACPVCRVEKRGTKDARGAAKALRDGALFYCHRCEARGSALDIVALDLLGRSPSSSDEWHRLAERCKALGLASDSAPDPFRVVPAKPAQHRRRPPTNEVRDLWDACRPVTLDPDVLSWLTHDRMIPADTVWSHDLARALPWSASLPDPDDWEDGDDTGDPMRIGGVLPAWCRVLRESWAVRHRLIVPLYDARGSLVSLRARAMEPKSPREKSAAPAGYEVGGLVMANPLALELLQGFESAQFYARVFGVFIAEGEPDYLTAATSTDRGGRALMTFGVGLGSWTQEVADRVPNGAPVFIATDPDARGQQLAKGIADTLPGRDLRFRKVEGAA
jgi:hypothetical protein